MLPGLDAPVPARDRAQTVYFLVIVLARRAASSLGNARDAGRIYGTNTYPVTYKVLDSLGGTFALFMLIVTASTPASWCGASATRA